MRAKSILLSFCFVTAVVALAGASDFDEGLHGLRWETSAMQYKHLTKVREADMVAYFVNANTLYQVANQPVPGVVYGFYQDKFFAVYIKLQSPDQFSVTARRFTTRYGNPKVTFIAESQETIYRWKDSAVKIKLKRNESNGDLKLGIYYTPLSDKLNQALLEQFPPDPAQPMSGSKKAVQKAPLLE